MPYEIKKQGNQWCVIKKSDGKVMGCHDTKAKAEAQMAAIHASEGKSLGSRGDWIVRKVGWLDRRR